MNESLMKAITADELVIQRSMYPQFNVDFIFHTHAGSILVG